MIGQSKYGKGEGGNQSLQKALGVPHSYQRTRTAKGCFNCNENGEWGKGKGEGEWEEEGAGEFVSGVPCRLKLPLIDFLDRHVAGFYVQ